MRHAACNFGGVGRAFSSYAGYVIASSHALEGEEPLVIMGIVSIVGRSKKVLGAVGKPYFCDSFEIVEGFIQGEHVGVLRAYVATFIFLRDGNAMMRICSSKYCSQVIVTHPNLNQTQCRHSCKHKRR
jgi:hypothetical protein